MANFDDLVDKPYRGKSAAELLKAPVSALLGVSKSDEERLISALGIRTIGDLASHWSVLNAQAIVAAKGSAGLTLAPHALTTDAPAADAKDPSVEKILAVLEGGDGSASLLQAWIGLQVYSYYALNLPTDDATLTTLLKPKNGLGEFTFVPAMKEAYTALKDASTHFLDEVYDKIVDLGQHLKEFSSDATASDGIFATIPQMIDSGDSQSALALLNDRIDKAKANAAAASSVRQKLTEYKTSLTKARDQVGAVKKNIDSDATTSQATITKLGGAESVAGSLANLRKMIQDANNEYKHDVIVASTTVTYAWVVIPPVPAGLISAAVVAGIYGHRAVEELKNISDLQHQLDQANEDLTRAIAVHATQTNAQTSVDTTLDYTNSALNYTNTLQQCWQTIQADLQSVADKLGLTIGTNDGDAALKSKGVVTYYLGQARKNWAEVKPMADTLVSHAYITVTPGATDWNKFLADVTAALPPG